MAKSIIVIGKPGSAKGINFPKSKAAAEFSGNTGMSKNEIKTGKPKNSKGGRPKTHGYSGTPTYDSYRNAKQRCTNPNHDQFADYGGRGIEFRFKDVVELVDDIGERPEGTSLDRIDPNGHYEPGNMRWATPKEQAANRRPADTSKYSDADYAEIAKRRYRERTSNDRQLWRNQTRLWNLSVKMFNVWNLSDAELEEIQRLQGSMKVPESTFSLHGKNRDDISHYIYLPSLTFPHRYVTVQASTPFRGDGSGVAGRGFITSLMQHSPSMNCSEEEFSMYRDFVRGQRLGLCIYGSHLPHVQCESMEGRFMVFAAKALNRGISARMVPAYDLVGAIQTSEPEDIYPDNLLIIPDLQVGYSEGYGIERHMRWKVLDFLKDRWACGKKTVVYAMEPESLGSEIASFLEHSYSMVPFVDLPIVRHDAPSVEEAIAMKEDMAEVADEDDEWGPIYDE